MRADVERLLNEFEVKTFGNKKNIEKAESIIDNNETLLFIYPTNLVITTVNTRKVEKLPGVVILTDKRLCFSYQIMFSHSTEIVNLDEIRAINSSGNGLTGGHIEIHTMTKTYDMLVSYKKDLINKILKVFEDAKNQATNHNNSSSNGNDIIEKIENLSALKEKGIISEEEFQQKKAELLSKL